MSKTLTKNIPVSIKIDDNNAELCGKDCGHFRTYVNFDECKLFKQTLYHDDFLQVSNKRCKECIDKFGKGKSSQEIINPPKFGIVGKGE